MPAGGSSMLIDGLDIEIVGSTGHRCAASSLDPTKDYQRMPYDPVYDVLTHRSPMSAT